MTVVIGSPLWGSLVQPLAPTGPTPVHVSQMSLWITHCSAFVHCYLPGYCASHIIYTWASSTTDTQRCWMMLKLGSGEVSGPISGLLGREEREWMERRVSSSSGGAGWTQCFVRSRDQACGCLTTSYELWLAAVKLDNSCPAVCYN